MPSNIHALMQDSDHLDPVGISQTIEHNMQSGGAFAVSGANRLCTSTSQPAGTEVRADRHDLPDVVVGLIHTPAASRAVPDFAQILAGKRR
jgi:hypothetical protein